MLFLFSATPSKHKAHVLCLENVLPYICEMLLKMFNDIKTFVLKIIAITFLIAFELLFSQHFEIQYNKNYSSNIFEKKFGLIIITITILMTSTFSQYTRYIFIQCCLDYIYILDLHLNDWPEKYCANIFVTFNSTLFRYF